MDPWLEDEDTFPNLHDSFLLRIRDLLNMQMPEKYVATVKQRIWVDNTQRREPDVSVLGPERWVESSVGLATLKGLQDTGLFVAPISWEEPYLEIITAQGRRLVTAVEMLSPSNKKKGSASHKAYLAKQQEFLLGSVNLLEIDLLRGGQYSSAIPWSHMQRLTKDGFHYTIAVTRPLGETRQYGAVVRLQEALPTIGIPLDPEDEPATLDLQAVLDHCYVSGRFASLVNYSASPTPKLSSADQTWATEVLRAKQLVS
jgi:hypothetical protein